MGNEFYGDELKHFFQQIQVTANTLNEVNTVTEQAVSCIYKPFHIERITVSLSVPQTELCSQMNIESTVLFDAHTSFPEKSYPFQYHTFNGGKAVLDFYPMVGYTWNEDNLRDIAIVANEVYFAFQRRMEADFLKRAVMIDPVVGIPNINGYLEFAQQVYAEGNIEQYVGIYFNIHNFKYVAKELPFLQVDAILQKYSQKVAFFTEHDEIVARLGGDNFVALIRKERLDQFVHYINNIEIEYQVKMQQKKFTFKATTGVSYLEGLEHLSKLMTRISIAYQVARQNEVGGVAYYSDDIYMSIMKETEIIAGFPQALVNQEFVVYYQPKVSALDKKLCGAEALVRWLSPEQELIPPSRFIPILERNGSVCELDFYVLDKACQLIGESEKNDITMPSISVNFSRKHIVNPELVKKIVATLDKHRVPHERIEIELTESDNYGDFIVMEQLIEDLKKQGISTSIDDFGTGYSSLNLLKMNHIDILKIDKSFIPYGTQSRDEQKSIIMFESIVNLAKQMGIKIVAEGVETKQQYDYLCNVGCDMIQGFYFDPSMPKEQFIKKVLVGQY